MVLSACQTGLGKDIRGEGLISLTRGFMYAGVPRVLTTLWRVDDRASAQLMKRFLCRDVTRRFATLSGTAGGTGFYDERKALAVSSLLGRIYPSGRMAINVTAWLPSLLPAPSAYVMFLNSTSHRLLTIKPTRTWYWPVSKCES